MSRTMVNNPDASLSTDVSHLLAQAADLAAATQVVLYERQARDRGWWAQMAAAYWPDAVVNLMWYHGPASGFVSGSEEMFNAGGQPVHHMFAPVVHVDGAKAHVEASTVTWSTRDLDGVRANFNTHMRLNYRVERRGEEWRILSMDCIYEYATVSAAAPGQVIEIPAEELARFRPSYAVLAWHQTQRGVAVSSEELGVDRPDEVARFYRETRDWLHS